jgi:hypothetical protein
MSDIKKWLELMEGVVPGAVTPVANSGPPAKRTKGVSTRSTHEETDDIDDAMNEVEAEETEITEELFDNWNVIYDSVHAKNIKANVRLHRNLGEEQVREWFVRTFNPLSILEMSKITELQHPSLVKPQSASDANTMISPARVAANVMKPPQQPGPKAPTTTTTAALPDADDDADEEEDEDENQNMLKHDAIGSNFIPESSGRPVAGQYIDLSDVYEPGSTEIWFWRQKHARDMLMGKDWLAKNNSLPDPANLEATHVQMGTTKETNPEQIYAMMQGEAWSPQGQAREMIRKLGTGHTSMSVGDIIVNKSDGKTLMVDTQGFTELPSAETNGDVPVAERRVPPIPKHGDDSWVPPGTAPRKPKPQEEIPVGRDNIQEGSRNSVVSAITQRIVSQHQDVLRAYGPEKVLAAIQDRAEGLDGLEEIGSSDVSIWTKEVISDLEKGYYDHLNESHEVKLEVHDDHEVAMAQGELYRLAKDAIALHNMLDNMANLQGWVSAKITLANDYMNSVRQYLENEMRQHDDNEFSLDDRPLPLETEPSLMLETEQESAISVLQHIVKTKQAAPLKFNDGSKLVIDMFTASAVVDLYNKSSDATKVKFDTILQSKYKFIKLVDTVFSTKT